MADAITAQGVVEWADGMQRENERLRGALRELAMHAKPVGDHTTLADLHDTVAIPRALFRALAAPETMGANGVTPPGELLAQLPALPGRRRRSTS